MKFSTVLSSVLLGASYVAAECAMVDGNYYCGKAKSIKYTNVGYGGSYKDVVSMDESTGRCEQKEVRFDGNIAPLDEELSVHLRGPLKLHQFAVYYPDGSGVGKREVEDLEGGHHKHKREAAVKVVELYSTVYVGASDVPVAPASSAKSTTTSSAKSKPTSSADSSASSAPAAPSSHSPSSSSASSSASSSSSSKEPSSTPSSGDSAGVGAWRRVAYYKPGSTDNCTFFNHKGGSAGSGTWSAAFGNSISYAASDGVSGAASPSALGDVTLKSNEELIIFSGAKCDDKSLGNCGYYRENIPAHHGFAGADKIFFFEFTMPSDKGSGFNQDMPAIWLLNAKIPRTLQYGDATCSCWKTGCGEMDLFEVLSSGSSSLISHVHDGQGNDGASSGGTGSQDYFERPYDTPMKAVVVFHGDKKNVHIVQINDNLGGSLSAETVSSWMQTEGSIAQMP